MVRNPYDPLFHEPKKNTLLSSGITTVKNRNGIAEAKIVLNLNMAMLANKPLYDKSNHQYFIVAEAENTHIDKTLNTNAKETVAPARPATPKKEEGTSIFDTIEIAIKNILAWDLFEADTTNKKVVVEVPEAPKKDDNNTCPRCKEPVTAAELKKIFTNADEAVLKKAAEAYTKYMKDLNMQTCWNKAHFFAQASIEVGLSFILKNGENLNYSTQRLVYGDYSKDFVKGNVRTNTPGHYTTGKFHKRPYSYFDDHKDEAEKYGRKDLNKNSDELIQKANEEMIANLAYGPNSKMGKQLGNTGTTDGWDFRGRGLVQLTGRANYNLVNKYTKQQESIDIVTNPEKVSEVNIAVLTSMGYWKNHRGDTKSNGETDENVLSRLVGNDVDYAGKKKSFDEVTSKLFKTSECIYKATKVVNTSQVIITFGANADNTVVSTKSLDIIKKVGKETKNFKIHITSTARDPYNQARVMYDNIVNKGMKKQRNTYLGPGQKVLDSYESALKAGKNRAGIIEEMKSKINEVGPEKVSKHCADSSILNVFDISQAELSNPRDFKSKIESKVDKVLDENACYHIEINQ